MSEASTRKANWFDRVFKRLGEFELDEWLGLLFWILVLVMFITDPLDLYENGMWWVYVILSLLLLLGLFLSIATLIFVGKIYFLVESRFEEYRRNELRQLFRENPYQLADGVVMRGKWKELYEMLEQNIPLTKFYRRTEKFQDVEVKTENGVSIEYPVEKWRLKDESTVDADVDEPHQVNDWDRFLESGWDAYVVPKTSRLMREGLWVLIALVVGIGIFLFIYGLLR
jgi:hypothetical protein